MTKIRFASILATLAIALVSMACNQGESSEPGEPAASTAPEAQSPAPSGASEEVAYEPAYPDEVSAEGLTEEDVTQQEAGHTRGDGEEHDHGEGGHSHDQAEKEEADHDHEHDREH